MNKVVEVLLPDGRIVYSSVSCLKRLFRDNPGAIEASKVVKAPVPTPAPVVERIASPAPKKRRAPRAVDKKEQGQSGEDGGSELADQSSPA